MSAGPVVTLSLIEEEHVHGRGSTTVRWFVRKNDGWVRASAMTGARFEQLERGAGVVWRKRIDLELEVGTRLLRAETRPDTARASTLAHLTQASRGARTRTSRVEYRAGPDGALERAEPSS